MLSRIRHLVGFLRFHSVHLRNRRAIERYQWSRLRTLIPYLSEHIALYRQLLAERGVNQNCISRLEDLRLLPIIDKSLFAGRPVEEYTDQSRPLYGRWAKTSGSSGTPFTPLRRVHTRLPWYGDSLYYRFLFWDTPWRVDSSWARVVHIRIHPRQQKNHLVIAIDDFLNDTEAAVQQMIDFQPDILETHPSLLFELASYMQKNPRKFPLKYIVSVSENLSPTVRAYVEEQLQCKVFNRYGLEEFGTVGNECSKHDGFHINTESFIVEIVDEKGALCTDGVFGRVLITDLFNTEMPFVRYDTGDRGQISRNVCACGLHAPRLWIDGRYSAYLVFDDRRFHHYQFTAAFSALMNSVAAYQVVKKGESDLVLRVIPGPLYTAATGEEVVASVQETVGPDINVTLELVEQFSRVPQGKSQIVRDESTHAETP